MFNVGCVEKNYGRIKQIFKVHIEIMDKSNKYTLIINNKKIHLLNNFKHVFIY